MAVQDEGTPLAARPTLSFVGAGVVATDDSAGNRTVVTIPSGGHIITDGLVALPARGKLSFAGEGVTATDDAGNDRTVVTVPYSGHVIADETTPLASRVILAFEGGGVTASDDSANNRTVITVPGVMVSGVGVSTMTVADFDTETSNGTANPAGRGMVYFADAPHLTPGFWNGTGWDYWCRGFKHTRVPLTGWTSENLGSSTVVSASGYDKMINGGAGDLRVRYRTVPARPYVISAVLGYHWPGFAAHQRLVMGFRQSSTGKIVLLIMGRTNSDLKFWAVSKYNTIGSFNGDYVVMSNVGAERLMTTGDALWQIEDDNTSLYYRYSSDSGATWTTLASHPRGDFMTGGPDQWCYGIHTTWTDALSSTLLAVRIG
jgi:hypothetical protein